MKSFLKIPINSLMLCVLFSCTKKHEVNPLIISDSPRKVFFNLYTDQDFSNDDHQITFRLFIQKPTGEVIWDSIMSPVQIKAIPDPAHKWVFEKNIPGKETTTLKVGFEYTIENVGVSWHFESFEPDQAVKIVDYNFR